MVPLCVSTPDGYIVACAGPPIVLSQVGAGGGVTAADTGSGDAAARPNDTAISGAMQRFTPGGCSKCCPLYANTGAVPTPPISAMYMPLSPISSPIGPSESPQPAPPITARRCARPP